MLSRDRHGVSRTPRPNDGVVLGLGSILGDADPPPWSRFPVIVALVVVHGLLLAWLGALEQPLVVMALVVGLAAWHAAVVVIVAPRPGWLPRDVASLVVAAVATAVEGGTESPLFFWWLLFLAAQALRHSAREFGWLCGTALLMYAAVVALAGDVTPASGGRAFLLAAYCGALLLGIYRLERGRARVVEADRFVVDTLDPAPVGIAIFTDDGTTALYSNAQARRVLGEQLDSEPFATASSSPDALRVESHLAEAAAAPGGSIVVDLVEGEGRRSHLRVAHTPVQLGDRRLLLLFTEDVTAEVQQEDARTRFLQAAAHQFRTPLTPITAYAELLAEDQLSPAERLEATQSIRRHAHELESLLEHLGAVLQLRSAPSLELEQTTVGALLDEVQRLAPGSAGVTARVGDSRVGLFTHLDEAARGLAELVSNSLTHGRPPVDVSWRADEGWVAILIRDAGSGPPIPDGATFADVWDVPGSDNTVSPRMGNWLGLARAAAYLDRAGGTLTFRHEPPDPQSPDRQSSDWQSSHWQSPDWQSPNWGFEVRFPRV